MRHRLTVGLLLALLGLGACTGAGHPTAAALEVADFASGAPATAATAVRTAAGAELHFPALAPDGAFLHLPLPPGWALDSSSWSSNADLLQLVIPAGNGLDIGVVPLRTWQARPLALSLRFTSSPRAASTPPTGNANKLFDLTLEQVDSARVRLSWTEVNRGDYDLNGLVNIADLTPLARRFLETYDPQAADAPQQPAYWVDGDGNGELSLTDVTVIGQRYGNQVAGYSINRNGQPAALQSRDTAELRTQEQLPPRYSAVVNGSVVDNWSVTPLDSAGAAGTGNTADPLPVDLSVRFSSVGLPLYSPDGSDASPDAAGHSWLRMVRVGDIVRVIDPIETVDNAEIGTALGANSGNAGFTGLPRGEWLLLQIALAPALDPATGQPWPYPADGSTPHYRCLHVPVKLPAGTLTTQLTVSANFVRQQGGGYRAYISSDQRGGPHIESYVELDYAAALASADTNGDLSFDDELRLSDTRLCGLSNSRLQQLKDDNDYASGTRHTAVALGTINNLAVPDGFISIDDATLAQDGGPAIDQGTLALRISETTTFRELLISASGTLTHEISPSNLRPGDRLQLDGYRLDDVAGLVPHLWSTAVTRIVDTSKPDKLYAWPDTTSAYPGEEVTIILSTEQSANPLRALDAVRITFNNASYVAGSLNVGAPGGARDEADGVWAQLGAAGVDLPNEGSIGTLQLPDGRLALDFYALPQGASGDLLNASGALLNFRLRILGDVTLGIQRLDAGGTRRTYYSDRFTNTYFWSNDFNGDVPLIEIRDPGSPKGPTDLPQASGTAGLQHTSDEAAAAP
jgi:hypothetical protein